MSFSFEAQNLKETVLKSVLFIISHPETRTTRSRDPSVYEWPTAATDSVDGCNEPRTNFCRFLNFPKTNFHFGASSSSDNDFPKANLQLFHSALVFGGTARDLRCCFEAILVLGGADLEFER